jgi:inorganic pyrophosphatase
MAPMPETLVPLDDVRKMKRSASNHSIESKGESGTEGYQIRAVNEAGRTISLWHDVSLVHIDPETQQPTPYLNFVCEIPKFTR